MVQVRIPRIGDMVIDIDPGLGFGCRVQGVFAEAWPGCAIKSYAHLAIDWAGGRCFDFTATRHECEIEIAERTLVRASEIGPGMRMPAARV